MKSVILTNEEFGQLMFVLANAEGKGITWAVVNPLLMKIGEQLRQQSIPPQPPADLLQAEREKRAAELRAGNGQEG